MGFMNDLKESVKQSRRDTDKGNTASCLPRDYESEPQHESDHKQAVDDPRSYEPVKFTFNQSPSPTNNKSNIVKALIVGGACVAIVAYLKPSNSTPNSELASQPTPQAFSALSSVNQQSATVPPETSNQKSDWHVVANSTGKCITSEGPAHLIDIQKELKSPYRTVDEKVENGRPVIVRVECPDEGFQIRYYRTKELCQSILAQKKQEDSAELSRYK